MPRGRVIVAVLDGDRPLVEKGRHPPTISFTTVIEFRPTKTAYSDRHISAYASRYFILCVRYFSLCFQLEFTGGIIEMTADI